MSGNKVWNFTAIEEYVRQHPDMTAEEIGRYVVGEMSKAELQGFVASRLAEVIDVSRQADASDAARKPAAS